MQRTNDRALKVKQKQVDYLTLHRPNSLQYAALVQTPSSTVRTPRTETKIALWLPAINTCDPAKVRNNSATYLRVS